ncbi:hypothetical protein GCM10010413_25380 [Promicromonospora sukumoe]|uniref:Htaa protein n=1 Tax=Promicromonospora sukumoe TaxID=88382 RepID=A0A7W3J8J4_9MICO|nr:hypothetical protein [Promicromonospora sukumoe]MBA8808246.1 hypothetical protein [Promicromonospora sukumoe]
MSRTTRRRRGAATAAAVVLTLLLSATTVAAAASGTGDDQGPLLLTVTVPDDATEPPGEGEDNRLTNAELRWAVSVQAGSESHLAGQCNFLVAGRPGTDGNTGGGRIWTTADENLYHGRSGDVRVLRTVGRGANATQRTATFGTRCTSPDGRPVSYSAGRTTGAEVVLTGGTGTREADGSVRIKWSGSFTVVFYGGLVYWWVTDPELRLDAAGNGALTGTLGGYGTDQQDMTIWEPLPATRAQLVTFTGRKLDPASRGGHLVPDYCGERVSTGSRVPQLREDPAGSCWGAFPQSFVTFHQLVGEPEFWYSTGTRDEIKTPANVSVSFDAERSVGSAGPGGSGGNGGNGSGGGAGAGTGGGGTAAPPAAAPPPGTAPPGAAGSGGDAGAGGSARTGTDPDAPASFLPVAAATLGAAGADLIPDGLLPDGPAGRRLAVLTAVLLVAASVAILGFRQGWLVLPFRRRDS